MITIYDIAERAQVSANTVSRALQTGASYKRPAYAKRARRIQQLAAEMGYRPNVSARATRKGKFNTVSLLMSASRSLSELPKDMLYGIQSAATAHDLAINLNIVDDDQLTDPRVLPKVLREWHCDGLLINYHKHPPKELQALLDRYEVPSVFLNLDVDHDSVRPDDFDAGRRATEHLIELGHRNIWYVGYTYHHNNFHCSELERRDGYAEAMIEAGLEPTQIDCYHPELGERLRNEGWVKVLASPDRPTAMVCYGSDTDLSVVHFAATRVGLTVPHDLSLVTFSGSPPSGPIAINSWQIPEYEVGRQGMEMLTRKIRKPHEVMASRKIPFTLCDAGRSVARCCPASD